MNTWIYINKFYCENITRMMREFGAEILEENKSYCLGGIKFIGKVIMTPIAYIISIYTVNRFSIGYLEAVFREKRLNDIGIKRLLLKEYHFYLKVKTISFYYWGWEKKKIDECFEYFETIYGFRNFTEREVKKTIKFSVFHEAHIPTLHRCVRKLNLFRMDISQEDLKDIFLDEKEGKRLPVSHNGEFAHFFAILNKYNLVPKKWGSIAENKRFFVNEEGEVIKASNFSSSKNAHAFLNSKKEMVEAYCEELIKC